MSRYSNKLLPPTLVTTVDALDEMTSRLLVAPAVAVDTESNSLYAYTERVCLVQFSVPGQNYLVDPLEVEDLSALKVLFADPEVEKVFHAAEYDVMVLRRDYAFEFVNVFDTMIASRIVGWPRYGLGALLEEHFGIETNKRMQRTNWGKRPLSYAQQEYAQRDTGFLIPLRDKLIVELEALNRVEEAQIAFARVANSQWTDRRFDPEGFWRIKGARDLDDAGLAVLRALYIYRDRRAQAADRPPFKVLNDSVLVALSHRCPRTFAELGRIRGIPRHLPSREKRRILSIIAQGLRAPPPKKPERKRNGKRDEATENRYDALREWRKQRAEDRGVEPDVILSNRTLHVLARHHPTSPQALSAIDALSDWERQEYGREIVSLMRRHMRFYPS